MTKRPGKDRHNVTAAHDGPKIAEWFNFLKCKVTKLAPKVPMNPGYLSELVNRQKANPSVDLQARIAKAMGITLAELYAGPPPEAFVEQASKVTHDRLLELQRLRDRNTQGTDDPEK